MPMDMSQASPAIRMSLPCRQQCLLATLDGLLHKGRRTLLFFFKLSCFLCCGGGGGCGGGGCSGVVQVQLCVLTVKHAAVPVSWSDCLCSDQVFYCVSCGQFFPNQLDGKINLAMSYGIPVVLSHSPQAIQAAVLGCGW